MSLPQARSQQQSKTSKLTFASAPENIKGCFIGTLVHGYIGTSVHWHIGTLANQPIYILIILNTL